MTHAELVRTVHSAYSAHFAGTDKKRWPSLKLVSLKCTSTPALTSEQAATVVSRHAQCEGWVRFRSALWSSNDGWCAGDASDVGPPLAAEWKITEDKSVHLRPDPDNLGCLAQWSYDERRTGSGTVAAGELLTLRQEVIVLAYPLPDQPKIRAGVPVLVYHVYWGADDRDPSAIRRLASRFVGFEQRTDRVIARDRGIL